MTARLLATALALTLSLPQPAPGQNISRDEGAFRLYLNGESVGREEFSITQAGMGAQARTILRGTVETGEEDGRVTLAPAMDARGPALEVSTYQVKVSGTEETQVFVNLSGNRYLSREISSQGERVREFRAGPGSIVLDEGIAHHYYLLTPFLDDAPAVSLTVLSPRAGRQVRMTLSLVGVEEVRVGQGLISDSRHYRLEGGEDPRDVWFDTQGRILRVEIPSQGYLAERESLS